ncbi:MAG: hypothetical protein QN198_06200 [Armatimonadota bacterium]|nr:hypothetical protein [Armatimonadota bacterium]MDR7434770.1 hypothetical protein [Armatimonadota bacterium]
MLFRPGDRVRIRPDSKAEALRLWPELAGRTGTVVSVYRDVQVIVDGWKVPVWFRNDVSELEPVDDQEKG